MSASSVSNAANISISVYNLRTAIANRDVTTIISSAVGLAANIPGPFQPGMAFANSALAGVNVLAHNQNENLSSSDVISLTSSIMGGLIVAA
jgi:hypothetical protein